MIGPDGEIQRPSVIGNAAGMGDIEGFDGRAGGPNSVGRGDETGIRNLKDAFGVDFVSADPDDPNAPIRARLPIEGGGDAVIPISTAPPGEMQEGAVAEFRISATGEIEILVSSHARPEHVEEALAHEFAELQHLMKLKEAGFSIDELQTQAGALASQRIKPGSTLEDVRDT